ncbi:MAG: serine/threonine-protein kinase [Planctomycetota bacterium]
MSDEAEDPLDEAFAAYLRSVDEGTFGSRAEFLAQFPEIADELQALMDTADAINLRREPEEVEVVARPTDLDADTIDVMIVDPNGDPGNPAATLPEANRPKDDTGPRLPYDLGDYELLEIVGRGGMGVVYRATQRMLDRTVAVKMIRGEMLACENDVRRFYTEAQAAASLRHPGIVPVFQFGNRGGHHFFSMALIEGTDLQHRINEEEAMPFDHAARYVRDVALAIEHAHQNDVLHRDIKPANVLIDEADQVHITDFGLAKNLDSDSSVTGSGAAVGTPNYMAPEQAGGHSDRATRQSDVYSLGAILFACVTGRPPLVGDSVVDTLIQVVHEPAPSMRSIRAGVPTDLETIVAKCLEKTPGKRYRSAEALAEDLDAYLEGRPIQARARGPMAKTWEWVTGVPLVGALIGRKVVRATASHRRFQAGVLLLFALMPFLIVGATILWRQHEQAMPDRVKFSGGLKQGIYNDISKSLAERISAEHAVTTEVLPSGGSIHNQRRLKSREVIVAPMQASAIQGDQLCVIAPLFYEAVHLLIRHESEAWTRATQRDNTEGSLADTWSGLSVAVGPTESGSRQTAEMVLDTLGVPPETTPRRVMDWDKLSDPDAPDIALICIGRRSSLINDLLNSNWKLMPIPESISISEQHPTLRPITLTRADYNTEEIPSRGLPTVATTAFLAARHDAPAKLVSALLHALYSPPLIFSDLIPERRAAEWQGLIYHVEARRFYSALKAETE